MILLNFPNLCNYFLGQLTLESETWLSVSFKAERHNIMFKGPKCGLSPWLV